MQRLSRFLSWFETQDIKTHSYFNRYLYVARGACILCIVLHLRPSPSVPATYGLLTYGEKLGDLRSPLRQTYDLLTFSEKLGDLRSPGRRSPLLHTSAEMVIGWMT